MVKGFKDSKGKFRPTGNKGVSSKSKTTKPKGLKFKTTKIRSQDETESLDLQLSFQKGKATKIDLDIDPKTFLKAVENDPNWSPAFGKDSMLNIKKRIEEGKSLDKPFLLILKHKNKDDEIFGHQGRHRVVTARELGIKKIPVEVYCKKGEFFANCNSIDEQVILGAISQFQNLMEVDEQIRLRNVGWEDYRKEIKRQEKRKDLTPDEELRLFKANEDLKRHDAFNKIEEETDKQREVKREKLKEIFK